MKLQQGMNRQPAFGMAFNKTQEAVNLLKKIGVQDEFEKAEPFLNDAAKNHDISLGTDSFGRQLMLKVSSIAEGKKPPVVADMNCSKDTKAIDFLEKAITMKNAVEEGPVTKSIIVKAKPYNKYSNNVSPQIKNIRSAVANLTRQYN